MEDTKIMNDNVRLLRRSLRSLLAMTGLIITTLFLIAGCGKKEPPKIEGRTGSEEKKQDASQKKQGDGVEHKVLSFNLEGMTEKGEKKWEVVGRTARSISENEIHLGNIVAKTFGDEEAVITADQGIYDKSKNNVRLQKNVIATIENAGTAVKDQLGFANLTALPAQPAEAQDPAKPKKKKKIIITCDGEVEFDYAKNLAYFKDNVKVKSSDGNIDADKITVNLNPGTKKINDIVAEGHVKITQNDNVAYSDSAKYNESDSKVFLKGSPKILIAQEGDSVVKNKLMER